MHLLGTKNRVEREEEEAERLVRPLSKLKPPRHDKRREIMKVDSDPDLDSDPDTKGDPDMSLNRREVGGSANFGQRFKLIGSQEEESQEEESQEEESQEEESQEEESQEAEGDSQEEEKEPPKEETGANKREAHLAKKRLLEVFPNSLATRFAKLDPRDIHSLIENYYVLRKASSSLTPVESIKVLSKVGKGFTLDPLKIEAGQPFNGLTQEDQEESLHAYRMEHVALNIALRERAVKNLIECGVPRKASSYIVDQVLKTASLSRGARHSFTLERARELFLGIEDPIQQRSERFGTDYQVVIPETDPHGRKKALYLASKAKNLDLLTLLVSTFQGEDYRKALQDFKVGSEDTFEKILEKIASAKGLFERRAKAYPSEVVTSLEDPYQVFRTYTRYSLDMLDPRVATQVRSAIAREEFSEYRKKYAEYQELKSEYLQRKAAWEREMRESSQNSLPSADLLSLAEPVAPKKPIKPIGYDLAYSRVDPLSIRSRLSELLRGEGGNHYSSYSFLNSQKGPNMPSKKHTEKTALYHGVSPYQEDMPPYVGWTQAHRRELDTGDFDLILGSAKEWLRSPVLSSSIEGMVPDSRFRAALDLAIRDTESGKYSSVVDANLYNFLLAKLAKKDTTETLLTIQASNKVEGIEMTTKKEAAAILTRLDKIAGTIQENSESWGIPFAEAKNIVNALDATADLIEKSAFGEEAFARRQVEVLKSASVLQSDSDEGYMDTFNSPTEPLQTDSDEGYMSLFKDDQTLSVSKGKSTTGRPLAP